MPVIMEFKRVAQAWPSFQDVYQQALDKIVGAAQTAWAQVFGGFNPDSDKFGETPIRPRFIQLGTNSARETWERNLATGWKTAWNNSVIEDVMLGIAGLIVPESANKVTAIQFQGGGSKLPVVNIDGYVDVFEQPIVVFPEAISVAEEKAIQLDVQSKFDGTKSIQPWGPAVAKQKVLIHQTPT